MAVVTKLTDEEVRAIAEAVFRRALPSFEFGTAEAHAGFDHDGEPALFITATFKPETPVQPSGVSGRVRSALHDALLAHGDERFPYTRWIWPDEVVLDEDPPGADMPDESS